MKIKINILRKMFMPHISALRQPVVASFLPLNIGLEQETIEQLAEDPVLFQSTGKMIVKFLDRW
jgi:hypothetical protein